MVWLSYNDTYDISDDGYVMNKKTGEFVKGCDNGKGYLRIVMWPSCKKICIHQMVAERFLPKINSYYLEIDHINKNTSDNRAVNLRWCNKRINCLNRNSMTGKSGHKYIYITEYNTYTVLIRKRPNTLINKNFKTLPEAIEARDLILYSLEYNT